MRPIALKKMGGRCQGLCGTVSKGQPFWYHHPPLSCMTPLSQYWQTLLTVFSLEVTSLGLLLLFFSLKLAPAILKIAFVRPPPGFDVLCFFPILPLQVFKLLKYNMKGWQWVISAWIYFKVSGTVRGSLIDCLWEHHKHLASVRSRSGG